MAKRRMINPEIWDGPDLGELPGETWREMFMQAVRGGYNALSRYLPEVSERLPIDEWIALKAQILRRDNYTCGYCGKHGGRLECDHVHPISRGGSNDPMNLLTACFPCNRSKRNKTVEEWLI